MDLVTLIASIRGLDGFDSAAVLEYVHAEPLDTVLLSGSLVDGSGTPSSDFDFCVIAEQRDYRFDRTTFPAGEHMRFYTAGAKVKASFDYMPDSLLGVDVEYRTADEIRRMIADHHALYLGVRDRARKVSSFAPGAVDFRLLSRLSYAKALTRPDCFVELTAELVPAELSYTAYRTAVGSYPDFRDLAGMYAQGDYGAALNIARKLGSDTFRGLTHVFGNTNRNAKYLARFAGRLPEELRPLVAQFIRAVTFDVVDAGDPREALSVWLSLIDATFDAIRRQRDRAPSFPTCEEFLQALRRELHETLRWNAEIDNEYLFRAREALPGLPPLVELLQAMVARRRAKPELPLRQWAVGRAAPLGEDNRLGQ